MYTTRINSRRTHTSPYWVNRWRDCDNDPADLWPSLPTTHWPTDPVLCGWTTMNCVYSPAVCGNLAVSAECGLHHFPIHDLDQDLDLDLDHDLGHCWTVRRWRAVRYWRVSRQVVAWLLNAWGWRQSADHWRDTREYHSVVTIIIHHFTYDQDDPLTYDPWPCTDPVLQCGWENIAV